MSCTGSYGQAGARFLVSLTPVLRILVERARQLKKDGGQGVRMDAVACEFPPAARIPVSTDLVTPQKHLYSLLALAILRPACLMPEGPPPQNFAGKGYGKNSSFLLRNILFYRTAKPRAEQQLPDGVSVPMESYVAMVAMALYEVSQSPDLDPLVSPLDRCDTWEKLIHAASEEIKVPWHDDVATMVDNFTARFVMIH